MRAISSFKAQYRQAPARASTPPPPPYEPLSPVLPPSAPFAQHPAGSIPTATVYRSRHTNGADRAPTAPREGSRAPVPLSPPAVTYEQPSRSAPLPQPRQQHSLPLASPIEALADAAVTSQQTRQAYVEPSRRASHAATSPATLPQPAGERAPKHVYGRDVPYSYHERPAKRARSEFYGSPPYGQPQSRPATSHIPGWAYNVEQMVDSGMRMYQDTAAAAPGQSVRGSDRISDAQLLLDFFNVSAHTAQTPPSTAKRSSVSYPAPSEQLPQPMQHPQELTSPSLAVSQPLSQYSQPTQGRTHIKQPPEPPFHASDVAESASTAQTHTPPEETISAAAQPAMHAVGPAEETKPKKHQGWPKGKPRGPRNTPSASKRKRSTPKPKSASSASTSGAADQLQSPQSLPAEQPAATSTEHASRQSQPAAPAQNFTSHARRHSFSTHAQPLSNDDAPSAYLRAQSLPLGGQHTLPTPVDTLPPPAQKGLVEQPDLICAACKSSESEVRVGDGEQWIGCDGCKEWYHYACAGFNSEREVRDVNKFYCEPCRPKFGETTKVRKSVRAHTTVDYAGLNEGVLKTSDDNPEHHYIAAFKNGDIEFTPETFARMPPELITGDFLEKSNGFKEPILVPGSLNPRPARPAEDNALAQPTEDAEHDADEPDAYFEYETITDDGQDALDMVIPRGLTVRRVAELYGSNEPVPVIDVKAQEGEGKKWTMGKWADYYEQQGEKPVRNVISLEVSRSRLGKLIRRPKAVRDMDLQDSVWREDDKIAPPPVQFYCLMSVADCFTDFHIDFGGSSVYYHIVKGRKVFFFIPPTKQNLKKYEDWCLSPNQGHDWLGKQVKDCYRVDLYPGDTMLIPSGWIHAVWTPEDSLVIGGNFLTRIHYGMQIKILEIEKNTKVALQFRYPFFQKIMWLTAIKYLEEDPIPEAVQQHLQSGNQFTRSIPIYCEPDRFGHNSHLGAANYNRRYYSKHELEGLSDLLSYIWRTVLITLDKIDVPQKTRSAVNKSIPKGHGDPLVLARRLAMWIAWKRGNETIPSWAFPDASLPEVYESGEKKLSAAQVKKLERETLNEALRATAERSSARIRASEPGPDQIVESSPVNDLNDLEAFQHFENLPTTGPLTGFLRPSANNPHITTPKTSQLGPKRVACDACRKRRIRCKHKDELIDTSKPGMHTIDLSGSYGISVKRRLSDHSIADGQSSTVNGPVNGGPIMADVNGDPYALKSGRVKACADCRKSKRRCIHDEYGNVDPVKANEVPIPRGSASKKRRVSDEDSTSTAKRMKHESSYDDEYINGDMHARHSLPNQFTGGSSFLQDLAYSAQQALDHSPDGDLVPVDPALQAYANDNYQDMDMAPSYHQNGENIMSSIEYQAGHPVPMDGLEFTEGNSELHGPSVEPLTPGPPPHSNTTMRIQTNGFASKPAPSHETSRSNAVRHPSSPVSPGHISTTMASPPANPNTNANLDYNQYNISPTTANNYNSFTTNSDFPPPPMTPSATTKNRPLPQPHSSGRKATHSHTPSRAGRNSKTPKSTPGGRRRDGQDGIKLEQHAVGMGMDMDMSLGGMNMIDPNLDQASIDLIKQLQQEDLGLRRRSR
ncbi:JmjC domain-containing histone demethylation protein 1 [Neocucurbitaria cava]|uniref:JmjC domain-containing histone demethylation protein 1 n=1 Tax=Neocucurbitaria cava TaxID=798079 RepID=A0A9W9CQW8_9PLEO|nr:JmjC domain-containing histone demethylation protein 1 [Neocucurbitaria cava]